MVRRAESRPHPSPAARRCRRSAYRAILRALAWAPSVQAESVLLLAARDWDPTYRARR